MNLIKRYNQIMGPKDERLEAEENKSMKVGGTILLIGSVLSLYYAIMLDQVSSTTGQPIFTALGEKLIPVHLLLVLTILVLALSRSRCKQGQATSPATNALPRSIRSHGTSFPSSRFSVVQ